jgi:hypothetical protein
MESLKPEPTIRALMAISAFISIDPGKLPRSRLLARNNFRVVRHLTAILRDSDNPRQPQIASEGYPVTTTWSAKGQVKRSLGKELEQPEFD